MKNGTRRPALLLILLFAVSVGCTRGGHQGLAPADSARPAAPAESPTPDIPPATVERIPLPEPEPEWRFEKVNYDPSEAPWLGCESQPCPSGVAFLTAAEHVCSAFLIEQDVVVTAAHCVSPGRMHIWFPDGERRTVTETLRISQTEDRLMPDFARLKLDRPAGQKALRVGTGGFPHDTAVKVLYWNKTENDRRILTEGLCRIRQNIALFPLFKNDFDRVTAITDCDFTVQSGHSGAPVMNTSGEVIGVLGSYIETRDLPVSTVMAAESLVLAPKVAIVTNLSCEESVATPCRPNFTEKDLLKEIRDLARAAIAQSLVQPAEALAPQIEDWKSRHSKVFRWSVLPQPEFDAADEIFTEAPLVAIPECFKPTKDWISDFRSYYVFLQSDVRVRGNLERWGTGVEVRDYVFKPKPSTVAFGHFVLQFDPADLIANGTTKVQMASVETRVQAQVAVKRTLQLGFCRGR